MARSIPHQSSISIVRKLDRSSAPYTPEQNGVSERRNRYIMDMVRCMLHDKNLPKAFWAEAASTAIFLQNRLPTKLLHEKTPFEAWYNYKPSLRFLKVFGSLCFVHIPQIKRDKLDKKAAPGIFVGYSGASKAYKGHSQRNQQPADPLLDETVDDPPTRGTRSLEDVYQRSNVALYELEGYEEAKQSPEWQKAMQEEISMIEKNCTWELVDRPLEKNIIGVKWIYRTKLNADSTINKHKARLVVKGYAQIYGFDYLDTFAPVARMDTIRLLLAVAAQKNWKVFQLDVKSAFLNGILQEEIYVEQPAGFEIQGKEDKVYLLKKALYGLKQAPRAWYGRIDDYLTGSNTEQVEHFKLNMMEVFEMTDLGLMSFFLGMEILQGKDEIFICQKKYLMEILKKFHMESCKPTATPMNQKDKFSKEDGTAKKQSIVAQSTAEAEFIAATTAVNQALWLQKLLRDLHMEEEEATEILVDNQAAIAISNNPKVDQKFESCGSFKDSKEMAENHFVQPAIPKLDEKAIDDQKLKDLKVKNYLFQAIDRSILETILNKETSKNIWDSLKQKYEGTTRVKRAQLQALRKEFEILQMKVGETVNDYFARTLTIANKMRNHGETMEDVTIIEKILRSMTANFNYVVCSIEESHDIDSLTIDQLQSSLLVHEQRMCVPVIEEQALKVFYEDRPGRGRGRSRGGFRGRGRGSFNFDKSIVECYHYHKLGHYQYECLSKQKEANFAEAHEEMLLMAYIEEVQDQRADMWFLDSGCSNHMSRKKDLFCELDEDFREQVKLGNNSSMMVKGKGNVKFQSLNTSQVITGVFYVPELKTNLLSIGQLLEKGLIILFKHGRCKIFHPEKGLIMETVMSPNRMFILQPFSQAAMSFHTITEDSAQLWHSRYGHLSYSGLKTLEQRMMVIGLPKFETPARICQTCLVGKQSRDSFPKASTWRASQVLQLIHSDICGPITPMSNSNKRYLKTFIDDYSRKTWVYFLAKKSHAFDTFKNFKNRVEKETSKFIKGLRTDRGGEYTSQQFNEFCLKNGINRQLTSAYTPHQNGVVERKNRTIMNMVRSMLYDMKIPRSFWPEAANWAVHVLNRCPTLAVKDMTPEEAWGGSKPSVQYFRVFGCISHVHVPAATRNKLDNRSVKCVLLGVSDESKAYRLYNPATNKIIVSRDVRFDEDKSWIWDENHEATLVVDLEWEDETASNDAAADEECDVVDETAAIEPQDRVMSTGAVAIEGTVAREHGDATGYNEAVTVTANANGKAIRDDSGLMADDRTIVPFGRRHRQQPVWMRDYDCGEGHSGEGVSEKEEISTLAMFASADPIAFDEAVKSAKWRNAMDLEIQSIEKNETWELTDLPVGGKMIGTQQYGVDYNEVFAPGARLDTVRLILALVAQEGWIVYQLDVKSAFLHGELSEEVFVEQPRGYEIRGQEQKVYKLKKALYGLKQAPRAWYSRIESYFIQGGFEKCSHEPTLFIKQNIQGNILIISLYVDDLIFTGNDKSMFAEFKQSMMDEFDMTDLGAVSWLSKKQPVVSLSTTEAEVIAAAGCACQAIWLRKILARLGHAQNSPTIVFCDNSSTIKLAKNPVMHGRSKHIDVRFHFLRDLTKDETIQLIHCDSQEQAADVMTKPLKLAAFMKMSELMGMCSLTVT
ncbi:hypothetical protein OIU84_024484 [Salix udensis]|uniref:Integrase catalytic domain-containing protein n=1 Tax=Salix udensis TaxID=889485 RepID=A0AAD6KHW4_9ROSI|nr:hypothetical protein OIU84_024484 [Salix udensis]